jgi:hypothetical protein
MLDRDQGVDPGEEHGIHVHEVHGEDGLGLGGEEALLRSPMAGSGRLW